MLYKIIHYNNNFVDILSNYVKETTGRQIYTMDSLLNWYSVNKWYLDNVHIILGMHDYVWRQCYLIE